MNLDFDHLFNSAIEDYKQVGYKHAEARGQYYQLDKSLKSIRAVLMKKYIEEGLPVSKAEIFAEASDDYKQAIKEVTDAGIKSDKLEVDRNANEFRYEATRSLCSLEKSSRNFV